MRFPASGLGRLAGAVLALTLGVATASASPITYTTTVNASGSLGDTSFSSKLVTLTGTADTADVSCNAGVCLVTLGSAGVTVADVGGGSFTIAVRMFASSGAKAVGFLTSSGVDILDTFNVAFATYDLRSAIGPITGSPGINSGSIFATTAGGFSLRGPIGNSTFTASTASAIPEPASLALLGLGLLGCAAAARRRPDASRAA